MNQLNQLAACKLSQVDAAQVRAKLLGLAVHYEAVWYHKAAEILPLAQQLPKVVPILSTLLGVKLPEEALQLLHQFRHISLDSYQIDLAGVLEKVPDETLLGYLEKADGVISWLKAN